MTTDELVRNFLATKKVTVCPEANKTFLEREKKKKAFSQQVNDALYMMRDECESSDLHENFPRAVINEALKRYNERFKKCL
jgi:hypothetical protein